MRSVVRRLAGAAVLLWIVLTLTFLLVRAAPGDPAALLVPPSASAADAARLRAELGLDAPLPVQYARWARGVLKGDLGESFALRRPKGGSARCRGSALRRRRSCWSGWLGRSPLVPRGRCS